MLRYTNGEIRITHALCESFGKIDIKLKYLIYHIYKDHDLNLVHLFYKTFRTQLHFLSPLCPSCHRNAWTIVYSIGLKGVKYFTHLFLIPHSLGYRFQGYV